MDFFLLTFIILMTIFFSISRDLLTEIELMLTTSSLPSVCTLLIEETIPRGMYVDPDQLRGIQEFRGLQVRDDAVNLRRTFESVAYTVLILFKFVHYMPKSRGNFLYIDVYYFHVASFLPKL